jgi:dihydroflavonol-4-reductase
MDTNSTSQPDTTEADPDPATRTVLVTGGSGYLASWTIVELLRRGYRVRTTIRNLAREGEVRSMIADQIAAAERLSFVQANLLDDTGWSQATDGADYVLHVASPMPIGEYRGTDIIGPALEGTRRVLGAARKAGVRRVVLTSSTEAALPDDHSGQVADETIWTEVPPTPAFDYTRAKTLAEREAWSFVESSGLELSTVLPCFMQGPVLGSDYSGSVSVVAMMLGGKMPAIPRVGWDIVDVRDIADLHLLAMTSPKAAGERFIGSGDFLWLKDIAAILRENLGEKAKKVPRRMLPNAVVRVGALFNAEMKQMVPRLDVQHEVSSEKAERMLGWKARPATTAVLDAAHSLIDKNLV